ncbi:Spermidine/putrescine import ATP-binding protein potA [Wickerhamomyces ciferrii]|uniref:Spermidine/putrescine import ATP-binding protein potA n=1 Tax=Wickerhamomyces ciferrii (strain ATCC 14091 / BCRC 22168 / CBS 111 / JCM 3599 / NBRC 0793 / NRRL Y-1031 F-60-10) TaxID=1206466 RepID=K0KHU5_WICCF|nr:Spermidine/putrescine import ATP-binding protein potA [Wickerhamomyces ciferrii]CCH40969.1 Spermidine/putrescine import ATP-binding protein potA [Wickerhamomyces ciferrii]
MIENLKMASTEFSVETDHLTYKFSNGKVGLANITIELPWNSRALLIGSNGAGKSTLLKLLAGKTLSTVGKISIGGHDPFRGGSDASNITTYLGTEWASNPIVRRDIPVTVLIDSIGGAIYKERRDELVKLLDIDLSWRMHQVSDGERRRVQLAMGLLKPWKVLLLDEVTVDLDVLVRSRLLSFLKNETETRQCSIIYATHIFDGLGKWPTNVIHIQSGKILKNLKYNKDIQYEGTNGNDGDDIQQHLSEPVIKTTEDDYIKIQAINSLHPLALEWLRLDLLSRGDREEGDLNRPKWEDLQKELELYYDGGRRVTDYFKATRE